jgi:hypothetical protein
MKSIMDDYAPATKSERVSIVKRNRREFSKASGGFVVSGKRLPREIARTQDGE